MSNEFDWENPETTEDFFSEVIEEKATVSTEVEDVVKEITKEEEPEETQKDVNLFENEEVENEVTEQKEEEKNEVPVDKVATLNYLKNKGLVSFELEDEEELTEELAEEILEDSYEEAVEEKIREKLTELPEDAQYIMQYVLKGGSVNDLLSKIKPASFISENLDLDIESNQEGVIRDILTEEGEDEEFIETQLELLKDSGKMKMFAEKKYNKWLQETKEEKAKILKQQEEKRANAVQSIREAKKKINSILTDTKDIGGIEPSKEDKKILPSFINDRTVKLQNGVEISEMQKELFYELPKNEKAMIQLAILLRNRNKDGTFNFSNISNKVKTEVTKEIKQNIRRNKSVVPASKGKKYNASRSLADYFTS